MSVSMEDIVDVYEKRDGIKYTGIATIRQERQALLETELRELAKYSPFVAAHLEYFSSGLLGWEEMLLRLSIDLAKQNKELFNDLVKMKQNHPYDLMA